MTILNFAPSMALMTCAVVALIDQRIATRKPAAYLTGHDLVVDGGYTIH